MSQPPTTPYPYPPQPEGGYAPQYGFLPYYMTPPEELLAPARRASLLLFVLAGLLLLTMTCIGASAMTSTEDAFRQMIEEMRRVNPQAAAVYTPRLLRILQGTVAVVAGVTAVVAIILALVVRGGGRAATITALVLVILATGIVALLVLASLAAGPGAFLTSFLLMLLPLVLLGMTISFLVKAIRAAGHVDAARQQMLMAHHQQMAYYQAQQQAPYPPQPPVG